MFSATQWKDSRRLGRIHDVSTSNHTGGTVVFSSTEISIPIMRAGTVSAYRERVCMCLCEREGRRKRRDEERDSVRVRVRAKVRGLSKGKDRGGKRSLWG